MIPGKAVTSLSSPDRPNRSNDETPLSAFDELTRERPMSKGGKKQIGAGAHGKGAGTGAKTDLKKEKIGDNMVLSNRDKSQHSDQRGMDGKHLQSEQLQDHAANR